MTRYQRQILKLAKHCKSIAMEQLKVSLALLEHVEPPQGAAIPGGGMTGGGKKTIDPGLIRYFESADLEPEPTTKPREEWPDEMDEVDKALEVLVEKVKGLDPDGWVELERAAFRNAPRWRIWICGGATSDYPKYSALHATQLGAVRLGIDEADRRILVERGNARRVPEAEMTQDHGDSEIHHNSTLAERITQAGKVLVGVYPSVKDFERSMADLNSTVNQEGGNPMSISESDILYRTCETNDLLSKILRAVKALAPAQERVVGRATSPGAPGGVYGEEGEDSRPMPRGSGGATFSGPVPESMRTQKLPAQYERAIGDAAREAVECWNMLIALTEPGHVTVERRFSSTGIRGPNVNVYTRLGEFTGASWLQALRQAVEASRKAES